VVVLVVVVLVEVDFVEVDVMLEVIDDTAEVVVVVVSVVVVGEEKVVVVVAWIMLPNVGEFQYETKPRPTANDNMISSGRERASFKQTASSRLPTRALLRPPASRAHSYPPCPSPDSELDYQSFPSQDCGS
jgi:hypothetical protein